MDTLKKCLAAGTSPVQVVRFAADYLREAGFLELPWEGVFETEPGGKYFVTPFPDVLFAFTRERRNPSMHSMRMAFAHVDLSKLPGLPDALKTVGRLCFFSCGRSLCGSCGFRSCTFVV